MCKSVGKADLLSDHFAESMESVDLPLTCHPSSSPTTLICLLSSEVRRLLLDLDPYWGTDKKKTGF